MYQVQLRKKLDEDMDTPSLSRFLSASHGFNQKQLACGQSNSYVNESYFGTESQKISQSKQTACPN